MSELAQRCRFLSIVPINFIIEYFVKQNGEAANCLQFFIPKERKLSSDDDDYNENGKKATD